MEDREINIGFDNTVAINRVVAILSGPGGLGMKRLRERAEADGRLLDVRSGRKTRSLIVTDSNHVILSAVAPETLWRRVAKTGEGPEV